jgi:methylmalonyl-CoA/ethylmalonyl-CoA epimerase
VNLRIDHTAIAVRDLDEALERYRRLIHAETSHRSLVADQRVEVAFLTIGDTELELIAPTDSESGVARFLDRRGEGLHHIGIQVDDIASELRRLEGEGVGLIDHLPRRGVHGMVAFVHPRATGGVLLELIQRD